MKQKERLSGININVEIYKKLRKYAFDTNKAIKKCVEDAILALINEDKSNG